MERFKGHFGTGSGIQGAAIVSTFNGGCFFDAAAAGWFNERFGRKRTIQIGSLVALWGCAMQAGAHNPAMLIIRRAVAGLTIWY
ncbi:mfs sugar [Moniliophthora roreri MCA 2997]|uniref:Mfs sugar n=1 Tax=Moniliophthora roreri (strain MCA 2997) TaxID=1381753 RepID=V2X9R5_MONRO|nr:mfs sugar [Moniliophthora roreri MCA 2997]